MAERGAPEGNENSAKGKDWTLAIKRALARRGEGDYRRGLDVLADRLIKAAESDDNAYLRAIEAVGDRMEGKPGQAVTLMGDQDAPIHIESKPPLDFDAIRAKREKAGA